MSGGTRARTARRRWARVGLAILAIVACAVAAWALLAPYTNGHGQGCEPLYRGGSTPAGGYVVMERGHDRCDLTRSDRLLTLAVAGNAAVGGATAVVMLRPGRMGDAA